MSKQDLNLGNISEAIKGRAKIRLKTAFQKKPYTTDVKEHDELLLNEILSFPLAKILVSFLGEDAIELFSSSVRKTTKKYLREDSIELDKKKRGLEPLIDLSQDLGLKVFIESQNLISINVLEYLSFVPSKKELKLVNQSVQNGKIFLTRNDFIDFLAEKSYFIVLESLPVSVENIPKSFKKSAMELKPFLFSNKKKFDFKITGKVKPENFPACMKNIYSQLLEGQNIPHSGRFAIATFLNQVGMPSNDIIGAFSKTPNFNERATEYQVNAIIKKGYITPACSKLRALGFCTKPTCSEKHPANFYFKQFNKTIKKSADKKIKKFKGENK